MFLPGSEFELRTHDSILEAGVEAKRSNTVVDGIKGETALSDLIDLVHDIPVDYMHCVLEGVTKRLLEYWSISSVHRAFCSST